MMKMMRKVFWMSHVSITIQMLMRKGMRVGIRCANMLNGRKLYRMMMTKSDKEDRGEKGLIIL